MGKSCSFGEPYMFSLLCLALVVSFFGFESRTSVLTTSVPGHCLPFTFKFLEINYFSSYRLMWPRGGERSMEPGTSQL